MDKSKLWILDEILDEGISERTGFPYYALRFTNCESKEQYWTYADQSNRNFKNSWHLTCHNSEYGVYEFTNLRFKKSKSRKANNGYLLNADSGVKLVELSSQTDCKDVIKHM
jgi:adenosine deaminase